MEGTVLCAANHAPLTPISFLERAALVYPDRPAVVASGPAAAPPRTWRETRARCLRLAAALAGLGVARHDVVAVFAQNIPAVCELHFGIPMAGAVICALNSRLDAGMASVLLQHSEAKVAFVDAALLGTAREALRLVSEAGARAPTVVLIEEVLDEPAVPADHRYHEYEALILSSSSSASAADTAIRWPADENEPIALNYTSGTTSRPKGVVYSHRGAYLNSLASVLLNDMTALPVYLWTVPMFHCNGWCLVWGVAAQGGTNVCLRKVTPAAIFDAVARHGVTHMGGAPTVLSMIVNATAEERQRRPPGGRPVTVMTGGAPPPPAVLFRMEELGFLVIHSYGLTETYGPATVCTWKPEWDALPAAERAAIKSRQGLHHLGLEVDVKEPGTMRSVPADGRTMGEMMFRGNTVMSGYLKDGAATAEAMAGGWLRSGDLAVRHGDGYVKILDRSKDIIISGGENISTIEVEAALFAHPAVAEAAVVGRPDEYWGETPCAFVRLKDKGSVAAEEVMAFCRARLPRYMAPRTVVFVDELPKTATGKVQKFALRDKAKAMGSISRSKL
ncbi:probable acyl-activating enzyme 1, peroxisomal [Panicum virgatum]|uniref:4-coumarate--CoA ligase n=1 Tax=Panicum virgatum TaxID=38727 RepID=A0A8T0WQN0_PANVG|nr:probable acyl-activating enzyme 1, peroxisomal [Panicum virgatum]KAG2648076.1 hypothetical protein PVAP13_1NG052100 [Panicum virgatum]